MSATTAEIRRNFSHRIRRVIRDKYAWPGGYPMYLVMSDGEPLCMTCARREYHRLARAMRDNDTTGGWLPLSPDINWEDPDLYCAHCGNRIESAYAED